MEKTALQLTIDKIQFTIDMWKDPSNEMDGLHTLETLKQDTINLLGEEKQQITEAYNMGAGYEYKYQSSGCTIDVKTSEQYYTETFTELEIK